MYRQVERKERKPPRSQRCKETITWSQQALESRVHIDPGHMTHTEWGPGSCDAGSRPETLPLNRPLEELPPPRREDWKNVSQWVREIAQRCIICLRH